ncbi:protein eiger isoform X2 [Scaptodrosophila lebanonensis]|uniref:Protein eiger isoform X2 n=1 Tax=Drosophila lebanonensis TaxID=7225 RepID=A0A6J2U1Q7_DROLE|nr:protein eiger isoform X2 [Scaptodrosophila lebanonensis]
MTAETLKPFITPTSAVDNFPAMHSSASHSQRKTKQLIAIVLSGAALALAVILLSLTVWQTTRVSHLDTELKSLKRVIESLQQRLGIQYLEDVDEFQQEYSKALTDRFNGEQDEDDNTLIEPEDEEYNEDYSYDYTDIIKKFHNYSEESSAEQGLEDTDGSVSTDDNVFDDFKNYNDSRKHKKQRKSRSIAEPRNDIQTYDEVQLYPHPPTENQTKSQQDQLNKAASSERESADIISHHRKKFPPHGRHFVSEHRHHVSPLRRRVGRRRHLAQRSSAKNTNRRDVFSSTPAAHFHLNRKVPHHNAPISLESYHGDMYIGHATAGNENAWQQHFTVHNGVLTVHEPGLYYVYAQICYNNTHDQNGFIIFHGHTPFLQCLNTVPTNMPQKVHTCHTSGLIQLQEQESIHLRDIHSDRNVMLKDANNRSYFGLIKV